MRRTDIAAKQAKVDSDYEELNALFASMATVDNEMSHAETASADKKRKTAAGAATSASSGAVVGPFGYVGSGSSAGARHVAMTRAYRQVWTGACSSTSSSTGSSGTGAGLRHAAASRPPRRSWPPSSCAHEESLVTDIFGLSLQARPGPAIELRTCGLAAMCGQS